MSEEAQAVAAEELHPLQQQAEQQAAPEVEGAGDAVADEATEQQEEQPKKEARTYTQEDVDRIVKKAKRNASYLARKEAEAELYRAQAERTAQPQRQQVQEDAPPKREDFDDYETYLEARADYRADQKVKEVLQQHGQRSQQQAVQSSEQERLTRYSQDLDKARSSIPDFDDVVESADVPVTQKMREAILESDVGALLTYHLAKNPAEAERIAKLSPNAQLKAIGVIEASLASKPAPQQSKAPAPIKPLSSSSGGAADLSKMSMDDYYEHRKKQGATWARR